MKLGDLLGTLDSVAPLRFAEGWDNVGLLAGDRGAAMERVLLTIDLTLPVVEEAQALRCDLVIAYHPPIFEGLKRIDARSPVGQALRHGIALYSPHTALDAALGGTNDVLADMAGLLSRAPLRPVRPVTEGYKLVTFVPEEHLNAVARAVWDAGGGRIGDYGQCSFRHPGEGTFHGDEGANPAVGEAGRLETVKEVRLEILVPEARISGALAALRAAHPYEEPAVDFFPTNRVEPAPIGMGRIGPVAPVDRSSFVGQMKEKLGVSHVLVAGPLEGVVRKVALAAGAAGDLLQAALRQGADVLVTGEVRHHDALAAAAAGMTVVCARHSCSERRALLPYRDRLAERAPQVSFFLSEVDADPFHFL
jgi:dinuclear metal center YbgI/SA1388 family protein